MHQWLHIHTLHRAPRETNPSPPATHLRCLRRIPGAHGNTRSTLPDGRVYQHLTLHLPTLTRTPGLQAGRIVENLIHLAASIPTVRLQGGPAPLLMATTILVEAGPNPQLDLAQHLCQAGGDLQQALHRRDQDGAPPPLRWATTVSTPLPPNTRMFNLSTLARRAGALTGQTPG